MGTLIGIIGLAFALFTYVKTRRAPRLAYYLDGTSIIGGSSAEFPKEVEVLFGGAKVERVTSTTLTLWNSGNTTIEGKAVVESDPLRVEAKSDILKVDVLVTSRDVNGIVVSELSKREAELRFDFLDAGDGATLQILHSGGPAEIGLCGTIRGMPSGMTRFVRSGSSRNKFITLAGNEVRRLLLIASAIVGIVGVMGAIFYPYLELSPDNPPPRWTFIVIGAGYLSIPCVGLWSRRKRYPRKLDPSYKDDQPAERT